VDDQLRCGRADHAGHTVDDQDDDGVPHLERAGEEQKSPRRRREHEQRLRDLNQPAAILAVRERPRVEGKQKKRHPVADDGKARQRR
jgi:hypothetical protein